MDDYDADQEVINHQAMSKHLKVITDNEDLPSARFQEGASFDDIRQPSQDQETDDPEKLKEKLCEEEMTKRETAYEYWNK